MSTKMHWRTATMVALVTLATALGSGGTPVKIPVTIERWGPSHPNRVKKAQYLDRHSHAIPGRDTPAKAHISATDGDIVPRSARG